MNSNSDGGAVFYDDNSAGAANNADAAGKSSDSGAPDFGTITSGLSQDNRTFIEKKGWDSLDKLVESHRNLERAFSSRSPSPGQTQGTTERVVPQSATEYDFKLSDDVPKDGFYDNKFAETFRGWAHEAKLSQSEAQVLHDKYVKFANESVKAQQTAAAEALNKSVTDTFAALSKEWGNPETPGFRQNMEMARRSIRLLEPGLKDALVQTGVIVQAQDGQEVVTNPTIVKALAKAGMQLFSEDKFADHGASKENPFDPAKPNLQAQSEIIKNNPELAKTLIKAADNKDWQWFLTR